MSVLSSILWIIVASAYFMPAGKQAWQRVIKIMMQETGCDIYIFLGSFYRNIGVERSLLAFSLITLFYYILIWDEILVFFCLFQEVNRKTALLFVFFLGRFSPSCKHFFRSLERFIITVCKPFVINFPRFPLRSTLSP